MKCVNSMRFGTPNAHLTNESLWHSNCVERSRMLKGLQVLTGSILNYLAWHMRNPVDLAICHFISFYPNLHLMSQL